MPLETRTPKPEHISEAEQKAYDLLMNHLESNRLQYDEFIKTDSGGVYTPEEIERDKRDVERKRSRPEYNEPTRRAKILEALIAEEIELASWLGDNAFTIIPTEFDDLFHGIDILTEFEKEGGYQYLAMGVDITTSPLSVRKKLAKIKDNMTKGKLTQMRYFASEHLDIKGTMDKIPSVIIGADPRTITELANLWLRSQGPSLADPKTLKPGDMDELRETAKIAKQELGKHRVQLLILKQIEEQLQIYLDYAREINNSDIASKLDKVLLLVRDIISKKKIKSEQERENESDDVYIAIKKELANFESL